MPRRLRKKKKLIWEGIVHSRMKAAIRFYDDGWDNWGWSFDYYNEEEVMATISGDLFFDLVVMNSWSTLGSTFGKGVTLVFDVTLDVNGGTLRTASGGGSGNVTLSSRQRIGTNPYANNFKVGNDDPANHQLSLNLYLPTRVIGNFGGGSVTVPTDINTAREVLAGFDSAIDSMMRASTVISGLFTWARTIDGGFTVPTVSGAWYGSGVTPARASTSQSYVSVETIAKGIDLDPDGDDFDIPLSYRVAITIVQGKNQSIADQLFNMVEINQNQNVGGDSDVDIARLMRHEPRRSVLITAAGPFDGAVAVATPITS